MIVDEEWRPECFSTDVEQHMNLPEVARENSIAFFCRNCVLYFNIYIYISLLSSKNYFKSK